MISIQSSNWIKNLEKGSHLCCIYESDDEHQTLLKSILAQGIERGDKVLYIVDSHFAKIVLEYLLKSGTNLKPFMEMGQLKIINSSEGYSQENNFNSNVITKLLQYETERALSEGFRSLQITSEMPWTLQGLLGTEQLRKYDAKLNEFLPHKNCSAICLYDARRFEPEVLLNVLETHPNVIFKNEIFNNYYYLTHRDLSEKNHSAITLQNWLENLKARKQAEDDLQHLAKAVKMSMDSIVISNLNGEIINANDATLRMFEIEEKDDLVGKNLFSFIMPESDEKAFQNMEKVLRKGHLRNIENNIRTKTGNEVPVETNIDLMKNKDGTPVGFIGITKDITQRKYVDEKLKESEEKYRTLIDASPEAITLIGLDGTLLDCNEVIEKIMGTQKNKLIGKSFVELNLFGKEDISRLLEFIPKAKNGESCSSIDLPIQYGKVKGWVEVFSAPLKKNNKVHALHLIARDITERKQAEEGMKRRLMRFKLDEGKIYLVQEPVSSISLEAFKDLLKVGYHGVVISRTPEKFFKKSDIKDVFEFLWLAEINGDNTLLPKISKLKNKLEKLPKKSIIFIDRLDYLIFKNGFRKTLSFIHDLREFAYFDGHIIIMSIDPSTLGEQELRSLEKECDEIESMLEKKKLPKEQFKILRFIYEENLIGVKPSYTNLGSELGISKPTVRKRIRLLISAGYVLEIEKGRNKLVELTEMGRNLFLK